MDSRASQDSCSEVAALVDARFLRPELFRYYYGGQRPLGVLHRGARVQLGTGRGSRSDMRRCE